MSDSLTAVRRSVPISGSQCSWLDPGLGAETFITSTDVTPPTTAYNLGAVDRLLWGDLALETTYSLQIPSSSRRRLGGRPVLPLLIEDFLTFRFCRTAGELSDAVGVSSLGLSPVGVAVVGTRYDIMVSFEEDHPLNPPSIMVSAVDVDIAEDNPARELRELTELPVDRLADVFGVSRVTFYNWMSDKPISLDNLTRLKTVVALLKQIRSLLHVGSREFGRWLIAPVAPSGASPLDFLKEGADVRVRSFAMRIQPPRRAAPTGVAEEAIRRSGVSRAPIRRVGSRGWANEVEAETLADRLEQLSPRLQRDVDLSDSVSDDSDMGWGVFHP